MADERERDNPEINRGHLRVAGAWTEQRESSKDLPADVGGKEYATQSVGPGSGPEGESIEAEPAGEGPATDRNVMGNPRNPMREP